jgi:radical SAM superfamily enzyme YgiQ (UPF0313 family)
MRIAFVSPNRELLPDAVVPIGLLYVMAGVPERHITELWDLCFETDPLRTLAERLERFDPDLVAVGMRNIQNNDYTGYRDTLRYYQEVFETIRAHGRAQIVLGGGGFSVMPQGLMALLRPDFGIAGEGERAFAQLVEQIDSGRYDLGGIGGLHHFMAGELVVNSTAPTYQVLDDLPAPDRRLVDQRHYAHFGVDAVQTKRGCPLRCDYCTYPLIEGRTIRQRDPARVVDELFQALECSPDIRHFFIVDSVFNLPPRHAKAVCREMIARGFRTPWTCYANPLGFDDELAELMVRAGCAGVEIGSDSGSDVILDRLKKGFHVDAIRAIHDRCERAGLPDCHTFILGTMGESLDDIERTLEFCCDLDPFAAILMIWADDYEALDPALATHRRAFRESVIALLRAKQAEFPRWIIPSLGTNFDARLFAFLRRRGFHGPLWQHVKKIVGGGERGERLRSAITRLPEAFFAPRG